MLINIISINLTINFIYDFNSNPSPSLIQELHYYTAGCVRHVV